MGLAYFVSLSFTQAPKTEHLFMLSLSSAVFVFASNLAHILGPKTPKSK
jgi:hypothetical protein